MIAGNSFCCQLILAQCPEIEAVRLKFICPECFGYFGAVMNEFRTTGAQGRPDTCHDILRVAVESLYHGLNRESNNILNAAPPSGMNISHGFSNRVIDQNRLAVCGLNDQGFTRRISDQRICGFGCYRGRVVNRRRDDGCSMYLIGKYQLGMPHAA